LPDSGRHCLRQPCSEGVPGRGSQVFQAEVRDATAAGGSEDSGDRRDYPGLFGGEESAEVEFPAFAACFPGRHRGGSSGVCVQGG